MSLAYLKSRASLCSDTWHVVGAPKYLLSEIQSNKANWGTLLLEEMLGQAQGIWRVIYHYSDPMRRCHRGYDQRKT